MIQGKVPLRLPKARSDLEYFDQEIEGEEVVVVRDPVRGTYHKYNPLQAAMLRKLDGRRTLDELVASLSEEFEVEIPRQAAERFVAHARERLLLDVASFNVSDARAQKAVLKALKREGFEFRGTGSSTDNELPARIVSGEAVLFMGGIRHLQAGQPARALDYFSAVLELNPNNTRAKTLVDCIQSAYVKALSGATTDFPTFAKFDPTRMLAALDRTIGKVIFSWLGVLLLVGLVAISVYLFVTTPYREIDSFDALDVVVVYTQYMIHAFMHEVGHGLACYHYGGKVPEIGFMRFYFVFPAPYCDTSSSYLFKKRSHKLLVQLSGIVGSTVHLCLSVLVLSTLNPDVFFYDGLKVTFYFGLVALLPNLIPFLKLDGYYALCDATGVPNLRERSFKLLKTWLGARLFGVPGTEEELTPGKRRFFFGFSVASVLFTMAWLYQFLFRIGAAVVERYQGTGLVLSVVVLGFLLRRVLWWPVKKLASFVVRERRRIFTLRRAPVVALVLGLVAAPLAIPWPVLVDEDFVLVPAERREVRAEVAGMVERVLVGEGAFVRRGQPIAQLENKDLAAELRVAEAQLEQMEARLSQLRSGAREQEIAAARAQVRGAVAARLRDTKRAVVAEQAAKTGAVAKTEAHDAAESAAVSRSLASAAHWKLETLEAGSREEVIAAAEAVRAQFVAQVDRVKSDVALLTLRSPIDGIVATKHLEDRRSAWLDRGDTLAEVHDVTSFVAEVRLPGSAPLAELEIGAEVALRAHGAPGDAVPCRIARIRDVAETGGASGNRSDVVVVTTPFTMTGGRAGMSGHARLYGERRSLAYAYLYLPLERLVRVSLWAIM